MSGEQLLGHWLLPEAGAATLPLPGRPRPAQRVVIGPPGASLSLELLPTADPGVPLALWNNGGLFAISGTGLPTSPPANTGQFDFSQPANSGLFCILLEDF